MITGHQKKINCFPQNIGDDCFFSLGISAPSEWVMRASAETGQAFFDEMQLKVYTERAVLIIQ